MSQMLGGATDTGAFVGGGGGPQGYDVPGAAGPGGMQMLTPGGTPETSVTDPGQMQTMLDNFKYINDFSMGMGDDPDERTKNMRALASMVGSLSKAGKDISQSTLFQRMMKGRLRPIATLDSGQQSGGMSQMPSTFSPDVAQAIMSRFGYGR